MQDLFTFTPLHFPTFGSQRTVFWNLEKYWAWISQNFSKNPYNFNSKKRLPLQFALKLRSKLRSTLCSLLWNCKGCFAVCFVVSKQKLQRVLRSLLRNFKANCKGTLHFDLKFYCFLKNFVRFMPNTFQNDIQKTSEWIKSMWWTWKKCCNPGLSNNHPVTL